ncbi:hypothetical protein Tco_0052571 [Tanacetum coccineum]
MQVREWEQLLFSKEANLVIIYPMLNRPSNLPPIVGYVCVSGFLLVYGGVSELLVRIIFISEKNRALEDMVNAMFVSPGLSHGMWGKAIISATYLLDILVKKEIGRSYRINDEVVQDQRQRDDNDLQDER